MAFNWLFRSKFLESKSNVAMKSIKLCLDYIEKVNFYRKRSLYQKWLKEIEKVKIDQLILIKFDLLDLLIDFFDFLINFKVIFFKLLINFKVIFFNLLIKNWLNSIDFNQKEIKIISDSWSTEQFFSSDGNRIEIIDRIWTAWNLNRQRFDSGLLIT